jgi:hypothetical protein
MNLIECLSRTGKRIHYAQEGSPLTLCRNIVHERRVGGSWRPERMDVTKWEFCERCRAKAAAT